MLIGEECCVPNTDYGIPMCLEESTRLSTQLENAMANEELTKEQYETLANKFKVLIPPDYFAARDLKVGIYDMPLYLLSYVDDEYGTPIILFTFYFEYPEQSIEEVYDSCP